MTTDLTTSTSDLRRTRLRYAAEQMRRYFEQHDGLTSVLVDVKATEVDRSSSRLVYQIEFSIPSTDRV